MIYTKESKISDSKIKELVESKSALSNYVDWKIVFFITAKISLRKGWRSN